MSTAFQSSTATHSRQRAGWTTDLRGQPAKLFNPMRPWLRNDFSLIGEDELKQIVTLLHGCQPLSRRGRRWVFGMVAVVLLLVIGSLGVRALTTGSPPLGTLFSAILNPAIFPAIVASFIPIYAARAQRLKKTQRVMLQHGRCPHCGYLIANLPVDSDHLTECPECAHAWLLPDPTQQNLIDTQPQRSTRRITLLLLFLTGLTALAVIATLVLVLR